MTWWWPRRVARVINRAITCTFNGRSSKFSEGSWGLIRVLDKPVEDLQPLPNKAYGKEGMPPTLPVCPKDAPVKAFNVAAIDFPSMSFNPNIEEAIEVDFERKIEVQNPDAKIYVLEEEVSKVSGDYQPMPLTLRANVGDCIKVNLTNKMKESRASFSAFGLAFDPKDSQGLNLGDNAGDQTVELLEVRKPIRITLIHLSEKLKLWSGTLVMWP